MCISIIIINKNRGFIKLTYFMMVYVCHIGQLIHVYACIRMYGDQNTIVGIVRHSTYLRHTL